MSHTERGREREKGDTRRGFHASADREILCVFIYTYARSLTRAYVRHVYTGAFAISSRVVFLFFVGRPPFFSSRRVEGERERERQSSEVVRNRLGRHVEGEQERER